jgi:type II secretory pathway component PulK
LSRHTPVGIFDGVRPRPTPTCRTSERGQASAELLGVLPAVLLVGALVWQLALAGHSAWLCANAARAAARAEAVGRDGEAAARSALPRSLRRGLRVTETEEGAMQVRMPVPLLVRSWRSPVSVAATARLGGEA